MKEEYVKFGTAKLLKEKGFDWEVNGYFCSDVDNPSRIEWSTKDYNSHKFHVSAPTQQMAMRWLREEKFIFISPFPTFKHYLPYSWRVDIKTCFGEELGGNYEYITYEDAVEAALEYVLTNLI